MSNTSSPIGLKPLRYLSGAPYNGAANLYDVPAADGTALFLGDPVKLYGAADSTGKYNGVIKATSGNIVTGVVVGFLVDPTDLTITYRKASTNRKVFVADNLAQLLFLIQADASVAAADVGLNCGWNDTAGSSTTGQSGVSLDTSTKQTTNTLPLKIVSLVNSEDNTVSDSYPYVVVMFNINQWANQIAGV